MLPQKQLSSSLFIMAILLSFVIIPGYFPQILIASPRLPNVTLEMERPQFWAKKIRNPTNLLLTSDQIHKMNEENLKRQDLLLCRVKNLKENWEREEILSLLKEDWENFGRTGEVRYGNNRIPLGEIFWNELRKNLNQDFIEKSCRILFGYIVKRTDIRVFPTEERSMVTPYNDEFDRFQHSSISPGSPIAIYYSSKDKEWAYVQTPFIRGWVRLRDLAIAKEKSEVKDYEEAKSRLLVTGNIVSVFGDPFLRQPVFLAQMGDSFPLLSIPGGDKMTNGSYIIHIPSRENAGSLTFKKGYIHSDEDVYRGFLPYTQENVAHQAFKMLDHPYGWGDMFGGRDCSRFIMDLFRTFGILMPRNSKEQAMVGKDLGLMEKKPIKEKSEKLDQAVPLATTLRLPGHIMLYLGRDKGKHYVIHSIWGIQNYGKSGFVSYKIGKVVVSDLSLGRSGPHGSLLHRLTDVRLIGTKK
jgi:hypothetical protein